MHKGNFLVKFVITSLITSGHAEEHEVWILDQSPEPCSKPSGGRSINDAMVSRYAEVNSLRGCPFVAFLCSRIVHILSVLVSLANRHNRHLRPQNHRHRVRSTNVSNARNTERSISVIIRDQSACLHSISKIYHGFVDLKNALFLNVLDVWNY